MRSRENTQTICLSAMTLQTQRQPPDQRSGQCERFARTSSAPGFNKYHGTPSVPTRLAPNRFNSIVLHRRVQDRTGQDSTVQYSTVQFSAEGSASIKARRIAAAFAMSHAQSQSENQGMWGAQPKHTLIQCGCFPWQRNAPEHLDPGLPNVRSPHKWIGCSHSSIGSELHAMRP